MTDPLPVREVLDEHGVFRWGMNDRIIFDENVGALRFYESEERPAFAFGFDENGRNTGISVHHRDWICEEYQELTDLEALKAYIVRIFSESYFVRRCWALMGVANIRAAGVRILHTPILEKNQNHHCDILPSEGANDYVNAAQYERLSQAYTIVVDNRPPST